MKRFSRYIVVLVIMIVISIILFITGKKHDITMVNNITPLTEIKYSVEGEPYKSLSGNKKAKFFIKGKSGVIFIKISDKVYTVNLKMDISGDYNVYVKEAISGSNFMEKVIENQEITKDEAPEENIEKQDDSLEIPN